MHYRKQYDELVNAMDLVGFTDEEEENLFSIIAGVLHLGNVVFDMDDDDASYVQDKNGPIKMAAVRFMHLTIFLENNYCLVKVESIKKTLTNSYRRILIYSVFVVTEKNTFCFIHER